MRKKAEEAVLFEVKTSALLKILKEMKEALDKSDDGVAIAAPQIGYSKRIFLVADKIFDKKIKNIPRAYINPKILKLSEEKRLAMESFEGQALVAYELGFNHPVKKEFISFESEMPLWLKAMTGISDE